MMSFEIETKNLTKSFGRLVAVNNLNLQIPKGTIFGFLGPNGSGKSTTVKMMTGLLKPTAGDAFIGGSSILSSPLAVKRAIGVLPEDLALFDALTIWEHLRLTGPIYGLTASETEQRAEQLLGFLDLWSSRHTFTQEASYGMKKKCSLAMALLHNPQVLFLDPLQLTRLWLHHEAAQPALPKIPFSKLEHVRIPPALRRVVFQFQPRDS